MENEVEKLGIIKKIANILIERKKTLISILIIIIFSFLGLEFLDYYKKKINREISEKYIKAGIYLTTSKRDQSKKIYIEIIKNKNKFYSILALNNIIENDLEKNSDEVLKLFNLVEQIKTEKDQKELVKLKKALYLFKISKMDEGNSLLKQIIADDSKWKNIALELIK